MENNASVLIVGAGPSGLSLALELSRRNISYHIIDKLPQPVQTSNALGIQPRTLEIWQQQGILPALLPRGHRLHGLTIHAGAAKILQLRFDCLDTSFPYVLTLAQSETERGITAYLQQTYAVNVERSTELTQLHVEKDRVVATCATPRGDKQFSVAWVIACDGGHSTVRNLLNMPFSGKDLTQHFIMADIPIDSELAMDEAHSFFAKQGAMVIFPLKDNFCRLICDVSTDALLKQTKTPQRQDFIRLVQQRCAVKLQLGKPQWISAFWIHARQIARYRMERVIFVGDAAHTHSPVGGQGMNSGIQDAYNLAWKLALVIKNKASSNLLDSYQQERHPVAKQIIMQTTRATHLVTLQSSWTQFIRNCLLRLISRIDRVREQMTLQSSQLAIHYRHSPICKQDMAMASKLFKAAPRAGDRLPYLPTLHLLLQGTCHHLLLLTGLTPTAREIDQLTQIAQAVAQRFSGLISVHFIYKQQSASGEHAVQWCDTDGSVHRRLGADRASLYLVRPDQHIGYRAQPADWTSLNHYLQTQLFIDSYSVK